MRNHIAYTHWILSTLIVSSAGSQACSAVVDLERFERADAGTDAGSDGEELGAGCENPRSLCVRLTHFGTHADDLVVLDLVTEAGRLRSRAMIDPLTPDEDGEEADIVLPLAIDEANVREDEDEEPKVHLELWGDRDDNHRYTPDPDHDWKLELPPSGKLEFEHDTNFTELEPRPTSIGGDFRMAFSGFGLHMGKMIEVMVIEDDTDRTVGLYRLQHIVEPEFEIEIPGVVELGGTGYRVEFYVDVNGNGTYDEPTTDHAWRLRGESGEEEAFFEFEHGTMFDDLEYQFDFED